MFVLYGESRMEYTGGCENDFGDCDLYRGGVRLLLLRRVLLLEIEPRLVHNLHRVEAVLDGQLRDPKHLDETRVGVLREVSRRRVAERDHLELVLKRVDVYFANDFVQVDAAQPPPVDLLERLPGPETAGLGR
jgi:hypothetical protein